MALETGTYISDLVAANPVAGDGVSQGDDHIRLLKSTIKATLPNVSGAVTPTHTELNYVDGVTSAIQTQLDAKAPLASPTLTGTPAAPTAATATNTTQIATTAYVKANLSTGVVLTGSQTGSAPFYGVRAWVRFDGTGSNSTNQTIAASGNVTTVFKNATGDYTVTMTTAQSTASYAVNVTCSSPNGSSGATRGSIHSSTAPTTTVFRIRTGYQDASGFQVDGDSALVCVMVIC